MLRGPFQFVSTSYLQRSVEDEKDPAPLDPTICGLDSDEDTCDDCTGGAGPNPSADGTDTDADGLCDLGDTDDDNDGCLDEVDANPLVASVDTDSDGEADDCDIDDAVKWAALGI